MGILFFEKVVVETQRYTCAEQNSSNTLQYSLDLADSCITFEEHHWSL